MSKTVSNKQAEFIWRYVHDHLDPNLTVGEALEVMRQAFGIPDDQVVAIYELPDGTVSQTFKSLVESAHHSLQLNHFPPDPTE